MIVLVKFISISCLVLFGSCLSTTNSVINPCRSGDFLSNLDKINKHELAKIEHELKAQNYRETYLEGCRATLLGRISLVNNRPSEASRYFSIAAKKLPELSDYFVLAKAFSELKNNNYFQAKELASALLNSHLTPGSSHFRARINQVLAEVALKEKDHHQVIKTHEALLSRGFGDKEALLFNLATSLGLMGEHQKADDILKQLLIRFPVSNHALRAQELKNLAQIHLNIKENETRFDKLIENLAFDRVVSDVDKELKRPTTRKNGEEVSVLHGFAIKALMLNNQFEKAITRAKGRALNGKALSKDFENYAWGLAKVDRFMEAAEYYTRMANSTSDSKTKARGCFFAGFSLYEASYYSLAQFSWQRCQGIIENSAYEEKYLWYQALSALLTHNSQSAEQLLDQLLARFPASADQDKYTYFLGFALHELHKKDAGDEVWRKLIHFNKPTYYALLARQALGLKAPRGQRISPDALVKETQCKREECKKALTLYHLGFLEEARDLIFTMKAPTKEKISLLQSMGLYHEAWQRSHAIDSGVSIKNNILFANPAIRSSYPLPHENIINEMSRKYRVKKSLLYAIIRTESGFLQNAKSYRGALGLMQMMPFVAHDLASKLALEQFTHESLKEPKVAIELGTLLLASLKRQFETMHLVVAAYNAGPHQVQKWLERFGHLPATLFVERIPFEQTRDYVKKVLPSESLYFALQGQPLELVL